MRLVVDEPTLFSLYVLCLTFIKSKISLLNYNYLTLLQG